MKLYRYFSVHQHGRRHVTWKPRGDLWVFLYEADIGLLLTMYFPRTGCELQCLIGRWSFWLWLTGGWWLGLGLGYSLRSTGTRKKISFPPQLPPKTHYPLMKRPVWTLQSITPKSGKMRAFLVSAHQSLKKRSKSCRAGHSESWHTCD